MPQPLSASEPTKTCSHCDTTLPRFDPRTRLPAFVGSRCRSCFNALRRERYRFDPFHRLARKRHANEAYSAQKKRLYMRRYRARRRARETSPPNQE
jgi:hypothetical protein